MHEKFDVVTRLVEPHRIESTRKTKSPHLGDGDQLHPKIDECRDLLRSEHLKLRLEIPECS